MTTWRTPNNKIWIDRERITKLMSVIAFRHLNPIVESMLQIASLNVPTQSRRFLGAKLVGGQVLLPYTNDYSARSNQWKWTEAKDVGGHGLMRGLQIPVALVFNDSWYGAYWEFGGTPAAADAKVSGGRGRVARNMARSGVYNRQWAPLTTAARSVDAKFVPGRRSPR